jgi:predicted transcriptional regulator
LLKPVALTVRLDRKRYAKLSAYAAGFTPRRSFQAIMVSALEAYLAEQAWGE